MVRPSIVIKISLLTDSVDGQTPSNEFKEKISLKNVLKMLSIARVGRSTVPWDVFPSHRDYYPFSVMDPPSHLFSNCYQVGETSKQVRENYTSVDPKQNADEACLSGVTKTQKGK